ncbi:hypothetical protein niasHS_007413 [Heterodera schachtii]|uniref:Ribosome biogenesis protein NOP53 n=1 Tax=Heterodera schachtii TaxID=97005 RepID=A0ABD2JXL4_HETSC
MKHLTTSAEWKSDNEKMDKKEKTEGKPTKKGQLQKRRTTPYDIWEDEGEQITATTKCKRVKYVPNLLPAVVPPPEGMSYNPPIDSYLRMAVIIANEERQIEKKRRRTERRIGIGTDEVATLPALREEVTYSVRGGGGVTVRMEEEKVKDEMAGGEDEKVSPNELRLQKRKTAKEKKRRKLRMEEERKKTAEKEVEGKMRRQLDSLKSLKAQVLKETETNEKRTIRQKRQRALKAFTKRKRLGRGKFEPFEEPLLTVGELPANLRQLSPQGNVLEERLKSFQRRNILPIAGERQPNSLKARLKFKMVEKRSVKEVDEDSRVI